MRWIFLLATTMLSWHAHAQRVEADLHCKATGTDYIYDCMIMLTRGGKPLPGAEITVNADMPSMPMAHNVMPVKAKPGKMPGEYRVRLDLDMQGEWALKLRLSGPVRDQVIVHHHFGERTAEHKHRH